MMGSGTLWVDRRVDSHARNNEGNDQRDSDLVLEVRNIVLVVNVEKIDHTRGNTENKWGVDGDPYWV